jgi:hypothetical protein
MEGVATISEDTRVSSLSSVTVVAAVSDAADEGNRLGVDGGPAELPSSSGVFSCGPIVSDQKIEECNTTGNIVQLGTKFIQKKKKSRKECR